MKVVDKSNSFSCITRIPFRIAYSTILLITLSTYYGCHSKVNCEEVLFITTEGGKNCDYSLQIGKCLHEKGQFELALSNYLASAKNCDSTSSLMTDISDCYFKLNNDKEAERFALLALKFDQTNNKAKYNLAVIHFNRNEFEKASQVMDEIHAFENDPEFYFFAFELYCRTGETDKARKNIEKAMELNPQKDEYKSRYAALLGSLGEREKAINLVLEIYQRTNDTSYYYFSLSRLLGKLYLENGDTVSGCAYFEKLKTREEFKAMYYQENQFCPK